LYREVLVLYLERPATQQCAAACAQGRFGYSDLKEAAPDGVLCTLIGSDRAQQFKRSALAGKIGVFDGRADGRSRMMNRRKAAGKAVLAQ
jgi:hypothetical protein